MEHTKANSSPPAAEFGALRGSGDIGTGVVVELSAGSSARSTADHHPPAFRGEVGDDGRATTPPKNLAKTEEVGEGSSASSSSSSNLAQLVGAFEARQLEVREGGLTQKGG